MKKILLFAALAATVFYCVSSCKKSSSNELTVTSTDIASLTLSECGSREDLSEILYLAIDTLYSNSDIKEIIYDEIVKEERDDFLRIDTLNNLLARNDFNLKTIFEEYLEDEQIEDLSGKLDCLIEGFTDDSIEVMFILNIPNSDLTNLANPAIKTLGLVAPERAQDWKGYYFFDTDEIGLDSLTTIYQPVWHVGVAETDIETGFQTEWAPFRRCYCTRSGAPTEGGGPTTTGTCSVPRNDPDACNYKCKRSGLKGDCSLGTTTSCASC